MKALSIRQPWVWAILHAGKRIENRKRRTHYRGTILLHASQGMTVDDCCQAWDYIRSATDSPFSRYRDIVRLQSGIAAVQRFPRGAIVGVAALVDCIDSQPIDTEQAQWWTGPIGWVLSDVIAFERPIPCKGVLGLWNVPPKVAVKVLSEWDSVVERSLRDPSPTLRRRTQGEKQWE